MLDHVQVKVNAPVIHAMSRVTFSVENCISVGDIISKCGVLNFSVVNHCFAGFIVHKMKKTSLQDTEG